MTGSMVTAEQSDFGWAVVARHDASEQDGCELWDSLQHKCIYRYIHTYTYININIYIYIHVHILPPGKNP